MSKNQGGHYGSSSSFFTIDNRLSNNALALIINGMANKGFPLASPIANKNIKAEAIATQIIKTIHNFGSNGASAGNTDNGRITCSSKIDRTGASPAGGRSMSCK